MAYEFRLNVDYTFGTLSANAAVSDTSMSAAAFASLPSSPTASLYIPLVLQNPSTGAKEIVYITAHTAAATTVTVVRGMEGTTALAWGSGSTWSVAPTVRDGGAMAVTSSTNPASPHAGLTIVESDTWALKTKTVTAGWQAAVGLSLPAHFTATATNGGISPSATLQMRGGPLFAVAPNGSGVLAVTFTIPFPQGVITAWAQSMDGTKVIGDFTCESLTVNGMNIRMTDLNSVAVTAAGADISYVAIGF